MSENNEKSAKKMRLDLVTGDMVEDTRVPTMSGDEALEALKTLEKLPEPSAPVPVTLKPASQESRELVHHALKLQQVQLDLADMNRRKPTYESVRTEMMELGQNPDHSDVMYGLTEDLKLWQAEYDDLLKLFDRLNLSPLERYELEVRERKHEERVRRAREKEDRALELLRIRTEEKKKLIDAREAAKARAAMEREAQRLKAKAERDEKERQAKIQKVKVLVNELRTIEVAPDALPPAEDL